MKNVQPIDCNLQFNALVDEFGIGRQFTTEDAASVLGIKLAPARRLLEEFRNALEDCPEGVQITVKRGRYGGHRFVQGDE